MQKKETSIKSAGSAEPRLSARISATFIVNQKIYRNGLYDAQLCGVTVILFDIYYIIAIIISI